MGRRTSPLILNSRQRKSNDPLAGKSGGAEEKNLSLDMNTLMAREGRTLLTRNLDYNLSRSRPHTPLVKVNAILACEQAPK